ncbi:hypothetical protein G9A89_016877 [Geosiphon pyriformis]|nr:hypothetical protein G9A89_016877 [Geosiphon pyriformis]
MPKVASELTRRETKLLIDLSQFPRHRYDYPMVLSCSRILYRLQIHCFSNNGISDQDIFLIVNREVDRLQSLNNDHSSSEFYRRHDTCGIFNFGNQLANTNNPLETIRSMLSGEEACIRNRSSENALIRRVYKNLLILIDDLETVKNNDQTKTSNSTTQRCAFRHVNFSKVDELISEFIGKVTSERVEPPMPLLWLPTLTNGEKVTQRKTSAFALRKRNEFKNSNKYRTRLLRMTHVQAISKNSHNSTVVLSNENYQLTQEEAKEQKPPQTIIIDIEEYQHPRRSSLKPSPLQIHNSSTTSSNPPRNLMSIQSITNKSDISLPTSPISLVASPSKEYFTCSNQPLPSFSQLLENISSPKSTNPHSSTSKENFQCVHPNLKRNLRNLCPCVKNITNNHKNSSFSLY